MSLRRRPLPVPDDAPGVIVLDVRGLDVTLRLSDRAAPSRKARPRGVGAAMIRGEVGGHWHYLGTHARTTATVRLPAGLPAGTPVRLAVCWMSPTGGRGPTAEVTCHVGVHHDVPADRRVARSTRPPAASTRAA